MMTARQIAGLRDQLQAFVGEFAGELGRSERRHWCGKYLEGLLMEGERKSIEPLAKRVGGDDQALQQFVNQSPWDHEAVMWRLRALMKRRAHAGGVLVLDDTSLPTHSCNTTKLFGAGDKIYALPTVGATQYRFKFENAGEGFVRVMTRPNYICLLNWTTLPLQVGVTYSVKVEVLVNGIWSGYCGAACNLTIGAPAAQGSASRDLSATNDANSDLMIWPNPVLNGQVNILLSDIADQDQNITIDVIDLFGKRVHAQQFNNSGDVFNTVLELDGLAAGVYVVTLTVNDQVLTERITVQ